MKRDDARKLAEELELTFKATDYKPGHIVVVQGIDLEGMHVFIDAFMQKHGNYYLVFPEHHEPQVFHKDEYYVAEYCRVDYIRPRSGEWS